MRQDARTPEQVKGQDGTCATMKVKMLDGSADDAVINAHDFDPAVHEEVSAEAPKKRK